MTHPTMTTGDNQLHVGRLAAPAWQAAVERLARQTPDGAEDHLLLEWRAAGIIDEDLRVAPDWQQAIDSQDRARAAVTLVAQMDDVAFLTTLHVCPDLGRAAAVTLRATIDTSGGGRRIDLIHPQAEVAMAPADRLWVLLRRVVPPLPAFRTDITDPHSVSVPVSVTPDSLATADAASASVLAHVVHGTSGHSEEAIWYLSDNRLHRLSPATLQVHHVPYGDVASGLMEVLQRIQH